MPNKQTKEQKKKEIDNAVRIFRESLEKTYLKEENEFYGIGLHSIKNFMTGKCEFRRLKNGNLKISGEVPKDAFNIKCQGLPLKFKDWDIYPLVITLFNKDKGVKE